VVSEVPFYINPSELTAQQVFRVDQNVAQASEILDQVVAGAVEHLREHRLPGHSPICLGEATVVLIGEGLSPGALQRLLTLAVHRLAERKLRGERQGGDR